MKHTVTSKDFKGSFERIMASSSIAGDRYVSKRLIAEVDLYNKSVIYSVIIGIGFVHYHGTELEDAVAEYNSN